jgi:glycosyltransferase involved in cell wall biosynthesis
VRLGVLDFNPIQYHVPLYQLLARRGVIDVSVLYLHDGGCRPIFDPGFGVPVAWNDVDLLSGYDHQFLATAGRRAALSGQVRTLSRWLRTHDAVVIHGYSNPWMLFAAAACRLRGVPYLLRGDSGPDSRASGIRRRCRDLVARFVVSHSAGGLAVGRLNGEFYRKYRAPRVVFAPHSVDNDRFAEPPRVGRPELLKRWGLRQGQPVIMFCGKLHPRKRPLDLAEAVRRLPQAVSTLFVGDGMLADQVMARLDQRGGSASGAVTGFVSQSELPSYYHAADILVLPSESEPWGLVVNEAMAAGVLPVVSDKVGAAPDLVRGAGEVFPCGDVPALAAALGRALLRIKDPQVPEQMRQHVARFGLEPTAAGFEQAALAVWSG